MGPLETSVAVLCTILSIYAGYRAGHDKAVDLCRSSIVSPSAAVADTTRHQVEMKMKTEMKSSTPCSTQAGQPLSMCSDVDGNQPHIFAKKLKRNKEDSILFSGEFRYESASKYYL
jgi:hypothetical protein